MSTVEQLKQVKIYGERNSGTNFLEQLLLDNLSNEVINFARHNSQLIIRLLKVQRFLRWYFWWNNPRILGWKHGVPKISSINRRADQVVIMTIAKNPYAFLLSLYKRPYNQKLHKADSFGGFIRQEWPLSALDGCKQRLLANAVQLWNVKNSAYLQLGSQTAAPVCHLRYEELLKDPEGVLARAQHQLGLSANKEGFTQVVQSTKGDERSYDEYRAYYLQEQWRAQLQQDDIEWINSQLDHSLVTRLGYTLLTTES